MKKKGQLDDAKSRALIHRTRVKVCCISTVEEARIASQEGADALGLVGPMPSGPGQISDEKIREIADVISPMVSSFLLTSRTEAGDIAEHVRQNKTSTVQVVSHIEPSESRKLAELTAGIQRVQVIHVEDETSLDLIPIYAPHVNAFLLDSGRPNAKVAQLGGTGQTHDWDISREFVQQSPIPVILAGGLRPENVAEAITLVKPYAVDLCSGVRTNQKLDRDKLRRFMAEVKRADCAIQAQREWITS